MQTIIANELRSVNERYVTTSKGVQIGSCYSRVSNQPNSIFGPFLVERKPISCGWKLLALVLVMSVLIYVRH